MKILVVVPARGGSKRIPHKNIALLGGKPLLCYTLEAIHEARVGNWVIVSTEDAQIAAVATANDTRILHRPADLCVDNASTESVLLHVLETIREEGCDPNWIMTLPPTSPFRTAASIRQCVDMLSNLPNDVDCLMSVTENRGDFWLFDTEGNFRRLFPNAPRRQQDRQPLFEENSAIYLTRVAALEKTGSILGAKVTGMPISAAEGLDINTPEDLRLAEAVIAQR